MKQDDLFSRRTTEPQAGLPKADNMLRLPELTAELQLPKDAGEDRLLRTFYDFAARAHARFESVFSKFLSPEEKSNAEIWRRLSPKLALPEGGIDSIFPPAVTVVTGSERAEISRLFNACRDLVPVSPLHRDQYLSVRAALRAHHEIFPPESEEQRLWFTSSSQVGLAFPEAAALDISSAPSKKKAPVPRPGFLTTAEERMLKIFSERAAEAAHKPADLSPGARLGRTNLAWFKLQGEFHPQIIGSKYPNNSILTLSSRYLRECMKPDRLPKNEDAAKQQLEVLRAALAVVSHRRDLPRFEREKQRFLAALRQRFQPPEEGL